MSTDNQAATVEAPKIKKWSDLYQHYRPIQLCDVVGQKNAIKGLTNSAKRESWNHAYMFAGAYGSGKTSIARILASLIVCPNRKTGSDMACGRCKYCLSIHEGHCVDVIEMDGAEQSGVEEARDLKKSAAYAPQELKKKIYLIDECHRLSKEANSALLKVLEEPPPFVHFIFCTTDSDKVLPTIISRCQRFKLTKIPSDLMAQRLEAVAKREGIKLEQGVSKYIARLSDGSLRDGLGNLEQVAIFSNGDVNLSTAAEFFGLPEKRIVYEIVNAMVVGNISEMMLRINDLIMSCVQPRDILFEISNVLRNIFMVSTCGRNGKLLDINDDEIELVEKLVKLLPSSAFQKMVDALRNSERMVAVHVNERWVVESALVNCAMIINEAQSTKK